MSEKKSKLSPLETMFGVANIFLLGESLYRGFYDNPPITKSFGECFTRPEVYILLVATTILGSLKAQKAEKNILSGAIVGAITGAIFTTAGYWLGYIGR